MRIKYLGTKSSTKSKGCPVCGAKVRNNISYEYSKRMTLPNGQVMIFIMNREYDVDYETGLYLTGFRYMLDGKLVYPFVEV